MKPHSLLGIAIISAIVSTPFLVMAAPPDIQMDAEMVATCGGLPPNQPDSASAAERLAVAEERARVIECALKVLDKRSDRIKQLSARTKDLRQKVNTELSRRGQESSPRNETAAPRPVDKDEYANDVEMLTRCGELPPDPGDNEYVDKATEILQRRLAVTECRAQVASERKARGK